ncbi:hypothetical protein ACPOL_1630 [Acidisarcina polymorpha]|uniref:Uncharacterized protein n=1 Tax=Acidisarcina polymorpha TaxID=2211140 RepID=A0A2Z5FX55_9BACT|nr:hypothetical protein [Acidisarcina polymorpha]AXC10976.1 hypothetical protein ACPOL_1630 [Acidisarcina polymorpha]
MAIKVKHPTFDQIVSELRAHKFDVRELPGVANEVFVQKNGVGAILKKSADGKTASLTANPGFLLCGEISRLLDRGNQKFLKTSKLEVPATADHLKAVHNFAEELRERAGSESLYNESLGTVSDVYLYDRVKGREHSTEVAGSGGH